MSLEEFTYNNYKSIQVTTTISPGRPLTDKLLCNYHFKVPPFPYSCTASWLSRDVVIGNVYFRSSLNHMMWTTATFEQFVAGNFKCVWELSSTSLFFQLNGIDKFMYIYICFLKWLTCIVFEYHHHLNKTSRSLKELAWIWAKGHD